MSIPASRERRDVEVDVDVLVHLGDPGGVPLRELLRDPVGHRRVDAVRDVRGQSSFPPQVWVASENKQKNAHTYTHDASGGAANQKDEMDVRPSMPGMPFLVVMMYVGLR